MTKLTQLLQKSGNARCAQKNFKKFTNYKANLQNYRIEHEPVLKNRIADSRDKLPADIHCGGEMNRMLDCFKAHDFSESECAQEVLQFSRCVEKARVTIEERKKASSNIKGVGGAVSSKQANALLKMYPQPAERQRLTHFGGRAMKKPVGHADRLMRRKTHED